MSEYSRISTPQGRWGTGDNEDNAFKGNLSEKWKERYRNSDA